LCHFKFSDLINIGIAINESSEEPMTQTDLSEKLSKILNIARTDVLAHSKTNTSDSHQPT